MQERRKGAGRAAKEPSGNSLFRFLSKEGREAFRLTDAVGRKYPVFKLRGAQRYHVSERERTGARGRRRN